MKITKQSMYGIPSECYDTLRDQVTMNADCVIKTICPQMASYYVRAGMTVIIAYVLINLIVYWFIYIGYKKYPFDYMNLFESIESRQSLQHTMLGGTSFGLLAFAAIVVMYQTKSPYFLIGVLVALILIKYIAQHIIKKKSKE